MIVEKKNLLFDTPLHLESGKILRPYQMVYETYGALNASGSNAILVCHALTSDSHAAGKYHPEDPRPGWWDGMIGPGKPLDTAKYFVVCSNVLGGCGGTTGPSSINPKTGAPYGLRFPVVTIGDMVEAQARLSDALNIEQYQTILGGCMGGFQVLEWLKRYPKRCKNAVVLSATPRTTTHNLGLWEVFRQAIIRDPAFKNGDYYESGGPDSGLALTTLFGIMMWMSRKVMADRFGLKTVAGQPLSYDCLHDDFEFQAFLRSVGENAANRFDANSLLYLWKAMDYFDLTRKCQDLSQVFSGVTAHVLLISYSSDWRYPPEEMDEIKRALRAAHPSLPVLHKTLKSNFGHGAFIYDGEETGRVISEFLQHIS